METTFEDRMKAALSALAEDDLRHINEGESAVETVERVFPGISEDFLNGLSKSLSFIFSMQLPLGPEVAVLSVFITGFQLGKQMGIGEGADMPSLFTPTEQSGE